MRTASGHLEAAALVSSAQYAVIAASGWKGCGAAGLRQRRLSSLVMTKSCSLSGRLRSAMPGSQDSRSIALRSTSASRRRTVGSPSQKRRPCSSCAPSMCGMPSLSTAWVPFRSTAGATHEQLTSLPSKGRPSDKSHRSCSWRIVAGSRSIHVLRSIDPRQADARRSGIKIINTCSLDWMRRVVSLSAQRSRSAGSRTASPATIRTALRGLRCNGLLGRRVCEDNPLQFSAHVPK